MKTTHSFKQATMRVAALLATIAAPSAFAASQTWSNAPQNALWAGSSNWIANAVPGALNSTGNGANGDTATFNSPLAGGTVGGASNPIVPDDATTLGARARSIGTVLFDTTNVGAYVIQSPSPAVIQGAGILETGYLNVGHNGAIRMNAPVTNSQTILVPLKVLLPSSTGGIFNLVNNSTNAATLTISSIMHAGATTRATTFILDGVNTGDNVVTNLSEGGGNATGGFTKQGTGKWIIRGTGVFPGASPLNIINGTLVVQAADAFGAATTATVTNGTLQFDGVTLNQFALNLRNGGNMQSKGTVSVNGVAVGNQLGNNCTLSTSAASDVFTVGTFAAANSIVAGGAADTVLNTAGAGTLVFGQVNTYVGRWSFNAKTNLINAASALGTGANANVGAGAIFDFTAQGAVSFVPTTSGFGGSGTGSAIGTTAAAVVGDAGATLDLTGKNINLTFTPTVFTGDTARPSLVMAQGTLAIGGNTFFINNASGTPLGLGTYRLITQTAGSITSGGGYAALISGSGMVGGATASIVVSGGNVNLVIAAYVPKNLVWSGTSGTWDIATTTAWLNGITASVFNNSDNVTFNSVGIANPTATLTGTLAPATVVVDTTAAPYTLGGAGQVAGTASITKIGTGVLTINTVNTYAGGTVVSNGTVRIGVGNAISSVGSGNVGVYGSGVLDLNGFNNTITALQGNGSVDNASGGASVLTLGAGDLSGSFSGIVKNTSGTLGVTKIGTGTATLSGANTYVGPTVVSAGTLEVQNPNALGSGASAVTVNSANLRTTTSLNVNSLVGDVASTVANAAGAGVNTIIHTGAGNFTGIISDGASGSIGIYVPSGTLQLNNNNTYSGGTVVASGATLAIGVRNPGGSGTAGTGGITASNSAIISMPPNVSTSVQIPNNITNVDANGTLYFPSAGQANSYNGQFIGGANATNVFSGPMSIGGALSFASFGGTVIISNGASVRFFTGTGIENGGENTTFVVDGTLFNRDARTTRIGALVGSGGIGNPSVSAPATYLIGGKNLTTTFPGIVSGTNNITKTGTGGLTLNGVRYWTNIVTLPDSSVVNYTLFSNAVTYAGVTTVSNGTLTIVAPNCLTNSPNITLAGGTLNATQIGYSTYQTTPDISAVDQPTNTVVVTDGIVRILDAQSLNGHGSLLGSVIASSNATMTVGAPMGTLAISGSLALNQIIVNMDLNRTNTPNNSDRITAASFSGSGSTLNVTDAGPALFTGTVCQLFSGPVSAFTTVNLPASNGATTYVWTNKIAFNGTIELLSGASPVDPNPTNITAAVTGGGTTLTLSWPSGHTGWTLQAQTNAINVGITGTWTDVAGSAITNQVVVPINPANPTVFYRLKL